MDAFAEMVRPERWSRVFGWATLAGLELGLIGPFGSYAANPFTRVAYWTALCWLGALLLWPSVAAGVARGRRRGFPPYFAGGVALLLASVPLATLAAAGCALFWPVRASGMRALDWYGLTLLVAAPATAAVLWLERRGPAVPSVAGAEEEAEAPPSRVPAHQLALASCLQMEDHYLRLHLPGGSRLYLASLRETLAELPPGRGLQVHRSWWVARAAVTGWQEEGRAVSLLLANGLAVPVARNRVAILRAAGWLDGARAA